MDISTSTFTQRAGRVRVAHTQLSDKSPLGLESSQFHSHHSRGHRNNDVRASISGVDDDTRPSFFSPDAGDLRELIMNRCTAGSPRWNYNMVESVLFTYSRTDELE